MFQSKWRQSDASVMAGREQRNSLGGSVMLGLAAKTLCIYASDITYLFKYACISTAASLSNFQAKIFGIS